MRPSPGGLRSEKGGDRNAQQRHWRTRSILPSLSPVSSTPGRLFGHGGNSPSSTPRASTGAFRRGGQFSTRTNFLSRRSRDSERGKSWPCIEHKGPPSTNNMHPKDGHDSRGRNYTLRRSPHVRVGLPPNLKVMSGRLPESQTHQSDSLVVVGGDRSAG